MNAYSWCLSIAGLTSACLSQVAAAQSPTPPRQGGCAAAVRALETASPGEQHDWAWRQLPGCSADQRVRVHLSAMQRARSLSDLSMIKEAIMPAAGIHDGRLLAQTLALAGDRGASTNSRVVAFMALALLRNPSTAPSYEGFASGLDQHGLPKALCSTRRSAPFPFIDGPERLPMDYVRRIDTIRDRVRLDAAELPEVRSAATCA